jgi:hypothetical protein
MASLATAAACGDWWISLAAVCSGGCMKAFCMQNAVVGASALSASGLLLTPILLMHIHMLIFNGKQQADEQMLAAGIDCGERRVAGLSTESWLDVCWIVACAGFAVIGASALSASGVTPTPIFLWWIRSSLFSRVKGAAAMPLGGRSNFGNIICFAGDCRVVFNILCLEGLVFITQSLFCSAYMDRTSLSQNVFISNKDDCMRFCFC